MDSRGSTQHRAQHPLYNTKQDSLTQSPPPPKPSRAPTATGSRPNLACSSKTMICPHLTSPLRFPMHSLQNNKNQNYKVTRKPQRTRSLISVLGKGSSVPRVRSPACTHLVLPSPCSAKQVPPTTCPFQHTTPAPPSSFDSTALPHKAARTPLSLQGTPAPQASARIYFVPCP